MSAAGTLAIAGGEALIGPGEHRAWPEITESDKHAVARVLDRGVLAGPNAPEIRALEGEYAAYVGARYCLATNAGTSSLHAALAAAGVEPGGEVIVPAYTFVASAFAAIHQGAEPVFCDVDPRTFTLVADQVEPLITDRTQAIMAVHAHGQPAGMAELTAMAARHGVAVVEDNSQAHGIRYRGRMTGSLSETSGASVNHSKNLPAGEGGLFTTDDEERYHVARRLILYGEDVPRDAPRPYWSHGVGWNYRSQEMVCALARSQLLRLDEHNTRSQENAERLSRGLKGLAGLELPFVHPDRECSFWKYQLLLHPRELGFDGDPRDLRDRIMRALQAEGVEVSMWQPQPVPAQPVFRRRTQVWRPDTAADPSRAWVPSAFPVASRICDTGLSLGTMWRPLYVQEPELMDRYVLAVEKVMTNLDVVLSEPFEPYPRVP
jgi:dTDP-4-amino-4,6-dideoxygalactose transaminase